MEYPNISPAIFLARPNRFIARVLLEGVETVCHVKNTGRCRELLIPGAPVWITRSENPARKTDFDLIAVQKGPRLINMDAQAPNRVFAQWARQGNFVPGLTLLRPERRYGSSRFDFYWEADDRRGFVEVKGVTLEEDGAVLFPDAPTQRGVRHLEELIDCLSDGFEATVCFVVQMAGVSHFSPNDKTHPAFGDALRRADRKGVGVLAMDCRVTPGSLTLGSPVPVQL